MIRRTKKPKKSLVKQLKARKRAKPEVEDKQYEGNDQVITTGSTLLDLAISGGRFEAGGIPSGILVEIFGPSSSGKTVILCEIAGNVQRQNGEVMFLDPEARLNKQFASLFGLNPKDMEYGCPNTVKEVFKKVQDWKPEPKENIHAVCSDSLAALSTEMEMESEDKYGGRRAKDFSEQLRKTCRLFPNRNILMLCSNQIRQNINAGPYGQKYVAPGGEAIAFYSSLRLRTFAPKKIKVEKTIAGRKVKRIVGVETQIEVFKSSVWKPYREATISIIFDYGIDDIRENLKFIKQHTKNSIYTVNGEKLHNSLDKAIRIVEKHGMEKELKAEVIELWHDIENSFKQKRKPKIR